MPSSCSGNQTAARTLVLACFASACLIPKVERHEYVDRGEACLVRAGNDVIEQDLSPEDELEIVVFFPHGCLSSSCSDVREATCEAVVAGEEIRVTSHGVVEVDVSGAACTEDCGIMTARCTVEIPEAGEFLIVHGEDTQTVELPGRPACSGGF